MFKLKWLTAAGLAVCALSGPAQSQQNTKPPAAPDEDPAALTKLLNTLSDDATGSANGEGPAGIVPVRNGPNGSLITTSQHDAAAGWTNILTPNVAWRFNRHFSVNAGLSVYTYAPVAIPISETITLGVVTDVTYGPTIKDWLLGDTNITGEFEAHPRLFDYYLSGTLGAPTGDDTLGLGAGRPTYYINNHFERAVGERFIPHLEMGVGNSLNLTDLRVHKNFTEVGTNAHFQLGTGIWLFREINFTTAAYEDLPVAQQTVTSVTSNGKKGKQLKLITTTTTESLGEDNGFLNTLDIPVSHHVTLSGFYNRSLRNKNDTAGFSLTFLILNPRADESSAAAKTKGDVLRRVEAPEEATLPH